MKTILIATDFSENSIDAAHSGIALAKKIHAKVLLFHVYSLPIQNTEYPEMIDFSAYEKLKIEQINQLKKELEQEACVIETACVAGLSFIEELNTFTENHPVDLIVMGLSGSHRLNDFLLGSNTLNVLKHSKIPVFAFPASFQMKEDMRFAFAYDAKTINRQKNIDLLLEISRNFSPKIHIFHVAPNKNMELQQYETLKQHFPFERFSFDTELNDNADAGILDFTTNMEIDVLALIPRKHSFFERLFQESHTHEIANYGKIPLFVLPE